MTHGNILPGVPDSVMDDERPEWERWTPLTTQLQSTPEQQPTPTPTPDRSFNPLRPETFEDIIGQDHVKRLLARMVQAAKERHRPLDHCLLVGPAGTGKTTFAHVLAHELGRDVYQLEAPVSHDTLLSLAGLMQTGDILFLDEIHQQAIMERRGRSSATQPEVLFSVMEDHTLPTGSGIVQFPHITIMGATTDEGMLPDAFISRFPIKPRLESYSQAELAEMAWRNALALGIACSREACDIFARASRGIPREIGNYVRNAAALTNGKVKRELALEVLHDLNGVTEDGLTRDMQAMLTFLYTRARRTTRSRRADVPDEVRYQASVNTIATAIGKSRDTKAIQLRVEPYLIEQGFVTVAHGGRMLTEAGVLRALRLLRGD